MPTDWQKEKLPTAEAAHPDTGEGDDLKGETFSPGVNPDIKHTPAGGTLKGDRGHIDSKTREWAIRARARGTYSSNVWKTVTDAKKCAELGIPPVTASRSGWDNCMRRVTKEELAAARDEYLSTFADVELAQKKVRVLELARMYRKFNAKARKGSLPASVECRMLLKQIADEVGEDARLEAVAKSGGTPAPAMTPELLGELAYLIAGELKPENKIVNIGSLREAVSDDVREPESGVPL
jgi:hypothetical protein